MRKGQDRHVGLSFSFPLFSCLPLKQKSRGTRALHMSHSPLYEVVVPGIVGNLWRWCSILELSILLRLNKHFLMFHIMPAAEAGVGAKLIRVNVQAFQRSTDDSLGSQAGKFLRWGKSTTPTHHLSVVLKTTSWYLVSIKAHTVGWFDLKFLILRCTEPLNTDSLTEG